MKPIWIVLLAVVAAFALPQSGAARPAVPAAAQIACDKGDIEKCVEAGFDLYNIGNDEPKYMASAAKLFKKACDSKNARGCGALAGMYYSGKGGFEVDKAYAFSLFIKGCDGGDSKSCLIASLLTGQGDGTVQDLGRAAMFALKGCELGSSDACGYAGTAMWGGFLGKPDPVRAVALWLKACDGSFGQSCFELGVAYKSGEGGLPVDLVRSEAMFKKACDLGDTRGCKK